MRSPRSCWVIVRSAAALAVAAWYVFAPASATAQNQPTPAAIETFAEKLRADVESDSAGGITAAVVVNGAVIWSRGFGWADREKRIPADRETIYRIGSISKTFTAVALLQLAERGVLRLEDRVDLYLPEAGGFTNPPAGAAPISFRHLATHTAGLIREPGLAGAASGPIEGWETKIVASIPTTTFLDSPGARYSYSNIGYGVLGLAISRAAKQPFMDMIERQIFTPLGMTSSTFVISPPLQSRLGTGYSNDSRGGLNTEGPAREHGGRGYKVPNGGIYSTVDDLARFIGLLSGAAPDSLLGAETRRQMLTIQTPGSQSSGYGYGLQLRRSDGILVAGHGGSVAGYTAQLSFDPVSRVGVVLLRNYNRGRTNLAGAANELLLELVKGGLGGGGN